MRLRSVHIKNFRALDEIDVEFDTPVSVIVGPNAVGKTTFLEAIRLLKATVSPRTQNEATQALLALGAAAPYNPRLLIPEALARDPTRPVELRSRCALSSREMKSLEAAVPQIATEFAVRTSGQNIPNQSWNIAFLSSPQGKALVKQAEDDVRAALEKIRAGRYDCCLDLVIDPVSGRATSADEVGALLFAFLDSRNRPNQTLFSYFPADRALPPGEQPVQLGAADAGQQIESHVSQPQLKIF